MVEDEPACEGVSVAALPVSGLLPSRRKEAAASLARRATVTMPSAWAP